MMDGYTEPRRIIGVDTEDFDHLIDEPTLEPVELDDEARWWILLNTPAEDLRTALDRVTAERQDEADKAAAARGTRTLWAGDPS